MMMIKKRSQLKRENKAKEIMNVKWPIHACDLILVYYLQLLFGHCLYNVINLERLRNIQSIDH